MPWDVRITFVPLFCLKPEQVVKQLLAAWTNVPECHWMGCVSCKPVPAGRHPRPTAFTAQVATQYGLALWHHVFQMERLNFPQPCSELLCCCPAQGQCSHISPHRQVNWQLDNTGSGVLFCSVWMKSIALQRNVIRFNRYYFKCLWNLRE